MTRRNTSLPAVVVAAGLAVLAGCTGMAGDKAAMQAAPVPPPPSGSAAASQPDRQDTKPQQEDLPDRLFAPLDDTVNDINRDINRDIDSDPPSNKSE
jgi:hypothetical protein